jgi:hypothetical protein
MAPVNGFHEISPGEVSKYVASAGRNIKGSNLDPAKPTTSGQPTGWIRVQDSLLEIWYQAG